MMSMRKAVLITAIHQESLRNMEPNPSSKDPPSPPQSVNILLGGAMLSGILIMVVFICYCCHRNKHKREVHLTNYWRDPASGVSLEVYTVEGQQLFESGEYPAEVYPRQPSPGPPPAYDTLVPAYDHKDENTSWKNISKNSPHDDDASEPPSYYAAIRTHQQHI